MSILSSADVLGGLGVHRLRLVELAKVSLDKITTSVGDTTYLDDADGRPLISRTPDGATLYLGATQLTLAKNSSNPTGLRYYQHAGDTIAARTSPNALNWLTSDIQGTGYLVLQ